MQGCVDLEFREAVTWLEISGEHPELVERWSKLLKKPGRPKKGTIIFNEVSKKFEGYDGTEWRTIKWED